MLQEWTKYYDEVLMAARKGKYAHVLASRPDLQRLPGVEPERRSIVDEVKLDILKPPQVDDPVSYPLDDLLHEMDQQMKVICRMEVRSTGGRRYAAEFARVYAELRKIKDQIAHWESSVNLLLDAFTELMIDQFENEGIASLRMDDGGAVATHGEPYPQVYDRETFRLWCLGEGLARDMHLHPKKTESLVKEILLNGNPEPPGVKVWVKTMIRLTKA